MLHKPILEKKNTTHLSPSLPISIQLPIHIHVPTNPLPLTLPLTLPNPSPNIHIPIILLVDIQVVEVPLENRQIVVRDDAVLLVERRAVLHLLVRDGVFLRRFGFDGVFLAFAGVLGEGVGGCGVLGLPVLELDPVLVADGMDAWGVEVRGCSRVEEDVKNRSFPFHCRPRHNPPTKQKTHQSS